MELTNMLVDDCILSGIKEFMNCPRGGILLYGNKGQGKYLLARRMAVELLGVGNEDDLKNHPDFIEIISHDSVIKMEELEPVRKAVASAAVNAKKKVFLIDDADMMTPNAQNSLLKLLEDMNEDNVVLMVCHRMLLQTIRSRCHMIEFYPQADGRIEEYLKKQCMPVNEIALAISGGCIGKYFQCCSKENYLLDVKRFFSVLPHDEVKELLKSLSLIKEKDTDCFFEKYSIEDVKAFMTLLHDVFTEILIHLVMGNERTKYGGFVDFETAVRVFSVEKIRGCQDVVKQHLLRTEKKGAYTKNDFFDLIRHL